MAKPPQLAFEIRRAQERRELALELYDTLEGEAPPPFPLNAKLGEDPEEVPKRLRTHLGIQYEEQIHWMQLHRAGQQKKTTACFLINRPAPPNRHG